MLNGKKNIYGFRHDINNGYKWRKITKFIN